ncbi:uncharacterized protein LOC126896114 [Daktulosphaira vitifoliae]|uniref:uncharacterized protein LOC126896114 n=1 Tax=Daktulosphaira vitifoliae TaxID=58002 RepID=UPI0021A9D467|nr:uncharacterized protein LOC126896114 [Daktulosphaira vitifoliae]
MCFVYSVLLFIFYPVVFSFGPNLSSEVNQLLQNNIGWNQLAMNLEDAIFDNVEMRPYKLKEILEIDSDGNHGNSKNIQDKVVVEKCSSLNNENDKEDCLKFLEDTFVLYRKYLEHMKYVQLYFFKKLYKTYQYDITPTIQILESVTDFSNFDECKTKLCEAEISLCNFLNANYRPVYNRIHNNIIRVSPQAETIFNKYFVENKPFTYVITEFEKRITVFSKLFKDEYKAMGFRIKILNEINN